MTDIYTQMIYLDSDKADKLYYEKVIELGLGNIKSLEYAKKSLNDKTVFIVAWGA